MYRLSSRFYLISPQFIPFALFPHHLGGPFRRAVISRAARSSVSPNGHQSRQSYLSATRSKTQVYPRWLMISHLHPENPQPWLFIGFSWDLVRWGGEIYLGAAAALLDFRLLLSFFKNGPYLKNVYEKANEKGDSVYKKAAIYPLGWLFRVREGFQSIPEPPFPMGGQMPRNASEERFPNSQALWHKANNHPYFAPGSS